MPSDEGFKNFIEEQLMGLDEISFRKMMGEYIIYYKGKIIGGIYDNRFLAKPVNIPDELIKEIKYAVPYEGAKKMIEIENVDDAKALCDIVSAVWNGLYEKNKRR